VVAADAPTPCKRRTYCGSRGSRMVGVQEKSLVAISSEEAHLVTATLQHDNIMTQQINTLI